MYIENAILLKKLIFLCTFWLWNFFSYKMKKICGCETYFFFGQFQQMLAGFFSKNKVVYTKISINSLNQ